METLCSRCRRTAAGRARGPRACCTWGPRPRRRCVRGPVLPLERGGAERCPPPVTAQLYRTRTRTVLLASLPLRVVSSSPRFARSCTSPSASSPPTHASSCRCSPPATSRHRPRPSVKVGSSGAAAELLLETGSLLTLPSQAFFLKLELHHQEQVAVKKKTRGLTALGGQCQWRETFHFPLSAPDPVGSLSVRLYSRRSVRRKQCLGQVSST